jgi:hypothetical protein
VDLFLKLAQRGTLANLPERLLDYRWHLSSISHTRNLARAAEIEQKISQIYQGDGARVLKSRPVDSSYFTTYESYCRWSILARRSGFWRSSLKYLLRILISKPLTVKSYWILIHIILDESLASSVWNRMLALKHRIFRSPSPHS